MRFHRAKDFISLFILLATTFVVNVKADKAFDKLFSAGKYKQAINYADEKLPIADRTSDIWAKLGVAHEEQKMIEKALACFMVGIRLDQKNYAAHLGAARVYNKMDQPEKALEMSKKAMGIKPTGEASWTFAQACIKLNRVAEAKTALVKVTEVDPSNMVAQRALGNVYYKEKNYKKAVSHLKKAYTSKPDGETALDLANAYKIIGKIDSAAIFYKEASRDRKSAQPKATLELARIYYQKKKYSDAAEEYGKVKTSMLTGIDYYQFGISIEKSKGNKKKMIEVLNNAVKKLGRSSSKEVLIAKEKIGRASLELKWYQSALSNLTAVRQAKGDSKVDTEILFLIVEAYDGLKKRSSAIPILEAIIRRDKKNTEAYARLADIYTKNKMGDKAKAIYEQLLSLDPNNPEVYMTLGNYNLKAKKYNDALKYFQKCFTIGHKAEAAVGMMNAAWNLKKYDIARDAAESALHKDKKLKEPQIILAKIYYQGKNYKSSASKLEYLLKDDPKNLELLELLANCYDKLKQKNKLAEIDKKIIDIDKKNVAARLRFARFSKESGDFKSAKSILIDLHDLQPKNSDVLKSLYEVSLKTGDKKDARLYLGDYLKINPKDAALQKIYGDLLFDAKNQSGALSAYRTAIKINPSIKGLYKRYAELVMAQKSGSKAEQEEVIKVLNAAVKAGEASQEVYATLGTIYKNKKEYVSAINMFQKALQKDPKDIESLSALAYCQEKAGKISEAIISYEQAAVFNKESVSEYKSLGDLYMKTGKKDQAIKSYKKYVEKKPDPSIASLIGDYEYNRKKYKEATIYYNKVSGTKAANTAFLKRYAYASLKSGDTKKAVELYKSLTKKAPKDPESFKILYEITVKEGDKKTAVGYLKSYTTLNTRDASSLQKLGDLYYDLKQEQNALDAYRNVLKVNPKAKGFYKTYLALVSKYGTSTEKTVALNGAIAAGEADAEAYFQLGKTYLSAKNYSKALRYFEKASQLDPKNIDALKAVALCQEKSKNFAAAILTYEQVVALDAKAVSELKSLGNLYKKQKKHSNAVSTFKKYLKKKVEDDIAKYVGDAELKEKNYKEAITYYDMVKGNLARQPDFLLNYAEACRKANNDDKALEAYRILSTITPKNPNVHYSIFDILFRKNKKDEALVYLKKYVAVKPADATAQKTLGDMLYARKDKSGAKRAYAAALKANPKMRGFYSKYAELVIESGNETEIASVLSGAVSAGEADVGMYKQLGSIYIKQKKYAQAIPMFEKASQLDPKDVSNLSLLAEAQAKSGKNSAAILTYEQVVALNPKANKEYKELGDLYKKNKKYDNAIKSYKKYLESNTNSEIAYEIGVYSYNRKEYSDAVKYFDKITGIAADSTSKLKMHADAARLSGNDAKAISLYQKLSVKTPRDPVIFKRLYELSEKSGNKSEMTTYLKKYAALKPSDAEAQIKLGNIYYESKNSTGALAAYAAAYKADPKAKGYFKNYGTLAMATGKENVMIPVLSSAIAKGEADIKMYTKLGSIYLKQKNYSKAMGLFEKASQLEPKNTSILGDLAKAQVASGNIDAGILTYEQVIAMNPKSEMELKELGDLYWKKGKKRQAVDSYVKYLDQKQDNKIARLVGQEMMNQKKYKDAIKYFGMVTGTGSNDPKHLRQYAQACEKADDSFKAYQLYRQLSNVTPKDPFVFKRLSEIAVKAGTKDDVLKYLQKYTTLKPTDADAQIKLGDFLYAKKDELGALTAYRAALKANPKAKGFFKNYALLIMKKGSDREKEIALNGAVASGEADAKMYSALGDLYSKKKLYAKAITAYEKASNLDPKNDKLLSALAESQRKKGAIREATTTYEQVIALNPRAVDELKSLAELYMQQKKSDIAIKYYKKYLDKKPNDASVALIVGTTSFKSKNYDDAAKFLGMVKGPAEKKASFIKMYGDASYETKDYPRAQLQYQKLTKLTPKDATVYKRLFEINMKSGAKRDAMKYLAIFTRYRPKDADAQKTLGDMYYDANQKLNALAAYRKAISANSNIKGIYKNYVQLVLKHGKYREKMSALNGAIKAGEADALVYKTLGSIYTKAKKYSKAVEMYEKAVKLDTKDFKLQMEYTDCLIKSGATDKAILTLEIALQLNPAVVDEYKLLGNLYMKRKKIDNAMAAYTKYLSKKPTDVATARKVGDHFYSKEKYTDAYKYYGLVKNENSPEFLVAYGMCAMKANDNRNAITILEKVRSSKGKIPNRGVAYKALSEAYEKSGDPRKAADVLHAYVKLPGVNDPGAAYQIASVYESINIKEAIQMFETNTKKYPKDYRNFFRLGMYYAKKHDRRNDAITYLEKTTKLVDTIADVYLKLGSLYNSMNRNQDMLRVYRKYLEIEPNNTPVHARIGEDLLSKNMVDDAMVFLEMANSADEKNPKYMTLLARGYLMTDRKRDGIKLIEEVIKMTRGKIDDDLRMTLADFYIETEDYRKAVKELKEVMETNREPKVLTKYAKTLLAAGKPRDALKIAEEVKAKQPENIEVQMMIGQIYAAQKKYNDAIETYKEILYVDQNYAPALCERANIYLLQGKNQWAQTFFDRALKADPKNPMVYLGLARLAKAKKDFATYTDYIEKARKLDPQNREIQAEMRSTR